MRNILLTPGPIPVPDSVREELAEPIIHHRTPQYQKIFAGVSERLKGIFLTSSPVYTITGSGTAAMEAALVNFHSKGDEVLVVEGGKFGERFTHIANAYGLKPTVIQVPWGQAVAPAAVEEALKNNPNLKAVCVQLCETSTAVLFDIQKLGAIVANSNAILIVDAISALGADVMKTDEWKVDITISGSQKALMLPPGLAFLSVSEKARVRLDQSDLPKFYVNLKLYEKSLKSSDTPFTPAIGLVRALEKALDLIEKEGIEEVWKRSAQLGEYTRSKLESLGMKLFSKAPSSTLSAALVPDGVDGAKLVKVMRDEKGVTMAGGQAELKGKIVRIAHMGSITKKDIDEGLVVLQETLQELKVNT